MIPWQRENDKYPGDIKCNMGGEKLVVASVLVILLLPGCIYDSKATSVEIVSVGDPDMVCHFGDRITLNVTVKSSVSMKNVTVSIAGLKNEVGELKLRESKAVDISSGVNSIPFEFRIPSCSPCNKLDPKVYYVNATVLYNGEIMAQGEGHIELKL